MRYIFSNRSCTQRDTRAKTVGSLLCYFLELHSRIHIRQMCSLICLPFTCVWFPKLLFHISSPSTPSNVHHYQTNAATVKTEHFTASASLESSDYSRRGSAGVVGSLMLLKSRKSMHIPYTQVWQHVWLFFIILLKYYESLQMYQFPP